MNYFMKCQLLSEGFKHEQLIEEDWEDLKKELTNLYVAGKITERQISTRLARAGMGSLSRNAAYKIAHDPNNMQKREEVFLRAEKEKWEKEKEETTAARAAKSQTRGSASAGYNSQERINAWLKAVKEYNEKHGIKEDVSLEEVKCIMENNMDNEELRCLLEDTAQYLLENDGPKKFIKGLKKAALGVAAAGALAAAPGVVGGVRNAKAQSDARKQVAQEYQMKKDEVNAKQNEVAKKIRDTGIGFGNAAKKAGNATKEFVKNDIARRKTAIKDATTVMKLLKNGEITSGEANALLREIKKNKGKESIQVNEEFELIEEGVSVNKVEKKLAKMKKLLNKPRNITDSSSFRDFSASEKEKMMSLISKVEKVLERNPKSESEIEKFKEDLEDVFAEFNNYSKACKAFKAISWWFLPLGWVPSLTRLYARMLRNLSNNRPMSEEVNYFNY